MSDAEKKTDDKDLREHIAEKGKAAVDAVKLAKKMGLIEKVVPKKNEGGGGGGGLRLKPLAMSFAIGLIVGVIVGAMAEEVIKAALGFIVAALVIAVVGFALYWFWWKKPAESS